jgi:capsular polysaccharide biosynthesis protein
MIYIVMEPKYIRYAKHYMNEVLEAMIAIVIIRVAMDKPLVMPTIIKESIVIGFFTFILELYNPDLKTNVSQGISFTVGSQLMARHI